jgi:menaquinone-dependent protoporphyrinogen IX oxidase
VKAAVLYRSKTGSVRRYAEWIAQELAADLLDATQFEPARFSEYDTIVFGGGLYAGGINGIGLIKDNLVSLDGKKVVVFACGASPAREGIERELLDRNFSGDQQKQIKFFYLRGGFDFSKFGAIDKILLTLLKWKIKATKENKRSDDEKGMLAAYEHPVDFTNEQNIHELLAYINNRK